MSINFDPQAQVFFRDAFEKFSHTISIEDERSFQATALKDVWIAAHQIEKKMAEERKSRDTSGLQAFLEGLRRFSATIEVLCNGTPYLPWIWAPVKFTLEIIHGHSAVFDTIIKAYGSIATTLPRFDKLGHAFRESKDFQQVLGMVYADILELHSRIYRFVHRSGWRLLFDSLWNRFDVRFKSILDDLAQHSDLADREANALDIIQAKAVRDRVMSDFSKQEEERAITLLRNTLNWLGAADDEQAEDHAQLTEKCHQGTCSWIFENKEFKKWMTPTTGRSQLWIKGKPGSGKSVLSAEIAQHLIAKKETVLFYTFSFRFAKTKPMVALLKCLCSQLLRQHQDLVPYIYDKHILESHTATLVDLKSILQTLLSEVQHAAIIIDGLDEIDSKQHVLTLKLLSSLTTTSDKCSNKIIVSSRDSKGIGPEMKSWPALNLNDECHAVQESIKTYVHNTLENLRERFQDMFVEDHVVTNAEERLVEKSNGMFLYTELVLTSMLDVHSIRELEEAVESLPEGLDEVYGRTILNIEKLPPRDRDKALQVLEWVAYATVVAKRPVKKFEVQHGLGLAMNSYPFTEEMKLSPDIFDLCKPLLDNGPGGIIGFVHFSAQEYLTHEASGPYLQEMRAHYNIAVGCLRQLLNSISMLDKMIPEHVSITSIGKGLHDSHLYADEYWLRHVLKILSSNHLLRQQTVLQLLDTLAEEYNIKVDRKITALAKFESEVSQLQSHPRVHRMAAAILKSRSDNSTAQSTPTDDDTSSSDVLSYRPWDLIRDRYNNITLHLLSAGSLEGLPDHQLRAFQSSHGNTAYTCRLRSCIRASDGFATVDDRDQHELNHQLQLRCEELDCKFAGFPNAKALWSHREKHHTHPESLHRNNMGSLSIRRNIQTTVNSSSAPQEGFNKRTTDHRHNVDVEYVRIELTKLKLETLPPGLKKSGTGWWAAFNPSIPRVLDIDHIHDFVHKNAVCCVCFSKDGKYIATGCGRIAQVFEVESRQQISELQDTGIWSDRNKHVRGVCFSPGGLHLATASDDHMVRIWDFQPPCVVEHRLIGHQAEVHSVAYHPGGRWIASCSADCTVKIWDILSRQCVQTLTATEGLVSMSFSPIGSSIAASTLDKALYLWDFKSGNRIPTLGGREDHHTDNVYSLSFCSENELITASLDTTVKLWHISGLPYNENSFVQCTKTFRSHDDFVLASAFTPSGEWFLSGSKDRGVHFWDPKTGQAHLRLVGHENSVTSIATSPAHGGIFATASGDTTVKIWRYTHYDPPQSSTPRVRRFTFGYTLSKFHRMA